MYMLAVVGVVFPLSSTAMPGLEKDKAPQTIKAPRTLVEQLPPIEKKVTADTVKKPPAKKLTEDEIAKLKAQSKSRSPDALKMRAPKFARLDKNSDGKMSLTEFKGTFPEERASVSLQDAFDHLDKDRSGAVSETEFDSFVAQVQSIQKAMKLVH